jgi:hypothetical protein
MLRKLVIASAVAAAAAGLGLASPAYGQDLVDIKCVGPTFGEKTTTAEVGAVAGLVTATGNAFTDLVHNQSARDFTYSCGNGDIRTVGNTEFVVGPQPGLLDNLLN